MDVDVIGLENGQRSDFELRTIFVEAFDLIVPFMRPDGNWISQAHEIQAYNAMNQRFPEISGTRLFAVLVSIAGVRASGRKPVD